MNDPTGQKLLSAVLDAPADGSVLLVYADYLEENNNARLGALLRTPAAPHAVALFVRFVRSFDLPPTPDLLARSFEVAAALEVARAIRPTLREYGGGDERWYVMWTAFRPYDWWDYMTQGQGREYGFVENRDREELMSYIRHTAFHWACGKAGIRGLPAAASGEVLA